MVEHARVEALQSAMHIQYQVLRGVYSLHAPPYEHTAPGALEVRKIYSL